MLYLRMAVLFAATITTGIIAGLFFAYTNSVMPALRQTDDRVLIDVMNKINVVIMNPWFLLSFMGTVGFSAAAAALHLGRDMRTVLIWIGVGLALNVIAFIVTVGCNVPLNDQLAAAGDTAKLADPHALRTQYENPWVAWNLVRGILHLLAFAALCGALYVSGIQHGKATAAAPATHGYPAPPAVAVPAVIHNRPPGTL